MSEERADGGLIALTVDEVTCILTWSEWTRTRRSLGLYRDEIALVERLTEWKRRHTESET